MLNRKIAGLVVCAALALNVETARADGSLKDTRPEAAPAT